MCTKEEQLEESEGSDWPIAERRRRSRFEVADGGKSGGSRFGKAAMQAASESDNDFTPPPPLAFAVTAPTPPPPELNALESTDTAGVGGGAAGVWEVELVSVALDCCCVGVEGAREPIEDIDKESINSRAPKSVVKIKASENGELWIVVCNKQPIDMKRAYE